MANLTFTGEYGELYGPNGDIVLKLPVYLMSNYSGTGGSYNIVVDDISPFSLLTVSDSDLLAELQKISPSLSDFNSGNFGVSNAFSTSLDSLAYAMVSPPGSSRIDLFLIEGNTRVESLSTNVLPIAYHTCFIIFDSKYVVATLGVNFSSVYISYNSPDISLNTSNTPDISLPIINFYRSTPPRDEEIFLERGQSIEVGFTAVYEGNEVEPYTGTVIWNNPYPDDISISGNIITVSETAKNPSVMLTAYPSEHEDGDTLYDFVVINISNPLGIYDTGGTTGGVNQTGGGGSYGRLPDGSIEQSDSIDIPNGTVASPATATGFFTRYLANTNTISTFGRWLWTTDLGLQVAKAVISLIYGDPAQSVISLMSYPFNVSTLPRVVQSPGNIIWGNFNSNISAEILNSQASQIDWGTIQLSEYWGNFLDYSPHTKVSLYLPWGTGFVDLDPGECLPGTLNVKTNIDFSKGSCVHNVIGNGNLIGSFAGQCAQQIPVLSSDFASKVAGLVTAAAAGISASAVGGAGILAEAAMGYPNATISGGNDKVLATFSDAKRAAGRIATTSLAINRHPVNVTRNGGFTDGSGALGCQYPYVIVSRPKQSMPEQYGSHFGYPSNIYRQLGTLRGYTEVGEIHFEGVPATDAELSELDRILKGGVIF